MQCGVCIDGGAIVDAQQIIGGRDARQACAQFFRNIFIAKFARTKIVPAHFAYWWCRFAGVQIDILWTVSILVDIVHVCRCDAVRLQCIVVTCIDGGGEYRFRFNDWWQ